MLRDVSSRVGLYQQVEVARVFVGGDGGVGADDFFGRAFYGEGCGDGHVLANGETEDLGGGLEGEAVAIEGQYMFVAFSNMLRFTLRRCGKAQSSPSG